MKAVSRNVLLSLVWLPVAGCGGASLHGGIDVRGPGCQRDFGTSTAASKVETFLRSVADLDQAAFGLEQELGVACADFATDLGMTARELAGLDARALCRAAYARAEAAESAAAPLAIAWNAPSCTWTAEAAQSCISECELRYRPGDIEVTCTRASDGACAGVLSSPQASPRCTAACSTRVALGATCSEGVLSVESPSGAEGALLAEAWRRQGARLLTLTQRGARLVEASARLVRIAPSLPEAAAVVSIRAVACATAAAGVVVSTQTRLATVAEVSVVFEGSVTAGPPAPLSAPPTGGGAAP